LPLQVAGAAKELLAIDECVENVLPVLLHQVVDVPENSTVGRRRQPLFVMPIGAHNTSGAVELTTWRGNERTV
jgi:hypothetical protein